MKSPTHAQVVELELLAWSAEGRWWHDIHPSTRKALWRNGWICEIKPREGCNTKGHRHPGYVTISEAGLVVLHGDRQ
jgi:hypothetical protein